MPVQKDRRRNPVRRVHANLAAVAYVRVSTEEQAREGVSLDAQRTRIRSYCMLAGLTLAEIVADEGVSGAKALALRPGGQRLVERVTSGRVQHVVALKLDRLFRDAADALAQTKRWDAAGVALHLVDLGGQTINTATATGRLFLTMLAAFAELERNMIAERTAAALAHKRAQRRVYSPTPYGYERVGDQLVPLSDELALVEDVRGWHAAGWTLRAIVAELVRRRAPTKRGGAWHPSTVRYLIENPLYGDGAAG